MEPHGMQKLAAPARVHSDVLLEFGLGFFIDEQTPDAAEKTVNAFNASGVPWLHHFERPHEHFVKAQGVGTKVRDYRVRIDDIPAGFGHFLTVFTEDQALIDKFEE